MAQPMTSMNLPYRVDEIVSDVLQLYQTKDVGKLVAVADTRYMDNAVFYDNVVHVKSKEDVKLQFLAVLRFFGTVTVEPETLQVRDLGAKAVELVYKNRQTYNTVPGGTMSKLLGASTVLDVTTTLKLDRESGKIQEHHDLWENKGQPPLFFRKMNASTTNFFLRLKGWGKELKSGEGTPNSTH